MSRHDVVLLRALREVGGSGISGPAIAAEIEVTAEELESRVCMLRTAGFRIEGQLDSNDRGPTYRLIGSPDRLIADDLSAGLTTKIIGNRIVVFEETRSTNDIVLQMASAGVAEGMVVFAEQQTAGRGQRGNRWESATRKGLLFSILLRPKLPIAQSSRLTSLAADAIANAIEGYCGLQPAIKPPNDVYIAGRKIAGVLVECRADSSDRLAAVMGIGVNINHQPTDFPVELSARATSLALETGVPVERRGFALALLQQLDLAYGELVAG